MLRILHLSDLHFSVAEAGEVSRHAFRQTREVPIPRTDQVFTKRRMVDEVVKPIRKIGIDGVIVTGDLTCRARPEEFATFVGEIQDLLKELGLGPDKLLLVPGNHDVDWSRDSSGRFQAYRDAFQQIRGCPPDNVCHDELILKSKEGERVRFVGMNSCLIECQEHAGIGRIGDELLSEFLVNSTSPGPFTATVLCLHHHLLPVSYEEREYEERKRSSVTLDAKAALEIAQRNGVDIVLHGHQHQPNLAAYGSINPLEQNGELRSLLWIAGAGSAGSIENDLGQANKRHFQVLSFQETESDVHCEVQAYTSSAVNNQEFSAAGAPISIHLGVPIPTGLAPHLRIEQHVLRAIREASEQTRLDESDLFITLLKTRYCKQVNDWLRDLQCDEVRIEGVYDLYGDFDLLVKVRAADAALIVSKVIKPLRTKPLNLLSNKWGRTVNVYSERYSNPPIFVPVDETSHSIKAFVYFTLVRDGDPIAEACSEIAARLGTRTVMTGAYIGDGATELMVEYLVACGAYYELSEIVTAIEGHIQAEDSLKVTLLAQRAWERPPRRLAEES